MKRIFLLVVAMCLLLTACGAKSAPYSVQTDWSKLTPYKVQSPIYSYYDPQSENGMLQPQNDYGTLLPYMGAALTANHYYVDLYGLVTTDGQIVTEPIYSYIRSESTFMLLTQEKLQYNEDRDMLRDRVFVAASDGSWVREIESFYSAFSYKNNYLVISLDDGSVIVLNDDGAVATEFPRSVFEPYYGDDYELGRRGSPILEEHNGILCMKHYDENDFNIVYLDLILDIDTGTVSEELPEGFSSTEYHEFEEEIIPLDSSEYMFLHNVTDIITDETYYRGTRYIDGVEYQDLLDETGKIIFSHEYDYKSISRNFDVRAGYVSFTYDGYFLIYSLESGENVFRYLLRTNID